MCEEHSSYRSSERGSALILALLVAALVATLAVEYSGKFMLDVQRSSNYAVASQAQYYHAGAERLAMLLLQQDLASSAVDHPGEAWAQKAPPFATELGTIEVLLEDAQARFNINSLAMKRQGLDDLGLEPAQRFSPYQKQFIRLLQTLEQSPLGQQEAIALTEAVIDCLDADDTPIGFGGAESLYYSGEQPSYQPANDLFRSVSELRLVRHMTEEIYQALSPLLVALPEVTGLNVNTAAESVLRGMNKADSLEPLGVEITQKIIQARAAAPFQSLSDFFVLPALQSVVGASDEALGLSVMSHYFRLHSRIESGELTRYTESLLQRADDGRVAVLERLPGNYPWQNIH